MSAAWHSVEWTLLGWEAWAPGLPDRAAWEAWAAAPTGLPADDGSSPAVAAMPAGLRRRAGRNDRVGLEPAYRLAVEGHPVVSVFASRHGQVARSAQLLEALALGTPLSPMDFSLSVHNACAGLFSISRGDRSAATALSARGEELSGALLEAAGLVLEGQPSVLVAAHDEPPPALYDAHWEREAMVAGLALRIGAGEGRRMTQALGPWDGRDEGGPQILELGSLLARGAGEARWARGGRLWRWELAA